MSISNRSRAYLERASFSTGLAGSKEIAVAAAYEEGCLDTEAKLEEMLEDSEIGHEAEVVLRLVRREFITTLKNAFKEAKRKKKQKRPKP